MSDRLMSLSLDQQTLLEYRAILENASVGILFTRDRKVLHCNPRFNEIFGYAEGELQGQPGRVFYLSDTDYTRMGEVAGPRLTRGEPVSLEFTMRRKDDTPIDCHMRIKPVNPHNSAEGTIWIFEDITERKKAESALQKLIHPAVGLGTLAPFWPLDELQKWDLDAPPPYYPEPTKGTNSRAHVVIELARRDKLTIRQLYEYLAGARGHLVVVGTPAKIADTIQEWFENGAADGFNVMPPVLPESLNDFVDLVIPELQRRGLFRTEYEGTTLRENLGLERPVNQFTVRKQKAA